METSNVEWLPELLLFQDYNGDWHRYLDAAYDCFTKDFLEAVPKVLGVDIRSKRNKMYDGKDHSFWHCIEEHIPGAPVDEDNRIPNIRLIERIKWPRPIIEQVAKSSDVLAWTEIYRGHGTRERAHLFVPSEDYVVVLDPRQIDEFGKPAYYYLWTTFLCASERQHQTMLRRYEKGKKMH